RLWCVVALVLDVRLVHDPADGLEPRRVEAIVAHQHLEGARAVVMAERVTRDVEGRGVRGQLRRVGNEQELGVRVDEPADEPGTGRSVDVAVLPGDPPHAATTSPMLASSSTRARAA